MLAFVLVGCKGNSDSSGSDKKKPSGKEFSADNEYIKVTSIDISKLICDDSWCRGELLFKTSVKCDKIIEDFGDDYRYIVYFDFLDNNGDVVGGDSCVCKFDKDFESTYDLELPIGQPVDAKVNSVVVTKIVIEKIKK